LQLEAERLLLSKQFAGFAKAAGTGIVSQTAGLNDMTTIEAAERAASPAAEADYPRPAYAWYIVVVLTMVYVFSFIDRQILYLLVGPIRRDLQISDTEVSLLSGFGFALFYTCFGIPLARIADSGSRRGLIAVGFVTWSLFTAGSGLARNFLQLLLMRMGVGVGEATLSPAAYSLITDYFPPHRRGTAQGVYNMAISLGSGLAFIVGGTVIALTSAKAEWILPIIGPVRSWQLVFFVVGVPGIVLALLMLTVSEPKRRGPGVAAQKMPLHEVLVFIKTNYVTLGCHNVGIALLSFAAYGSAAWVPTFFIRHFHWSAASIGQGLGFIAAIFGTGGMICGGWFSDYLARRGYKDASMRVALCCAIAGIPAGLAYVLMPTAALSLAALAISVFFGMAPMAVAPAALMEIAPARMRSQLGALYLFVINFIGLGFGPTSVALLTDYVFHDDNMVGSSLLIVNVTAPVCAALILWGGLRPFARTKGQLNKVEQVA
jgi:MFS family permease